MHPDKPSDPPHKTAMLPSGPGAYVDEGQGPTVLAIHGLPGSARDFRWLTPAFCGGTLVPGSGVPGSGVPGSGAPGSGVPGSGVPGSGVPGVRVVRVDLPGFGATPMSDDAPAGLEAYAPEARAHYVIDMMDALGLEDVVLAGHSMGGVVAGAVAVQAPQRVAGLVLIASPGPRKHRGLRGRPDLMSRVLSRRWARRALAPVVRRAFHSAGFRGDYSGGELVRTVHGVAALSIEAHAERLRQLALPTAVVWCDDDPLVESEIALELADLCPEGPRLRFASGGHNPQKHRAIEMADGLLPWIHEICRSQPSRGS